MSRLTAFTPRNSTGTTPRARWLRWGAIATIALVPLAFAGLFIGALSPTDTATTRIPAAIVNEDSLITTTLADGTEQNVFAGRLLVSELTASAPDPATDATADGESAVGATAAATNAFDWRITNASEAERALAAGEVYAILTVPANFSSSIMSISTDAPEKANISIRTDDAHSYLTGTLAQTVGQTMVDTFGKGITSQYISGIYTSIGDVGSSLATAADGAGSLSGGATELSGGLTSLAGGAASASSGAAKLSSGVATYTAGVNSLSGGLQQLSAGAGDLNQVSNGVDNYTDAVQGLAANLAAAYAMVPDVPSNADARAALAEVAGGLTAVAGSGVTLDRNVAEGITGIQRGISTSASGAAQLAAGSSALTSGASTLASGLSGLTTGASSAASGASELATGASELATGLETGATQVPSFDPVQSAASAEVASEPVTLSVTTDNPVTDIGQAIATLFVPLGLWLGALAVFLVLRPLSRRALASTAGNGRLMLSVLARAGAITAAQALLLVGLLHTTLELSWTLLPATAAIALLMAAAFTAFHYLLTLWLGRLGLVVSLLLVAIQITATGGLYPIELLAAPFQGISPLLPLTYGVQAMQGIISGGDVAAIGMSVVALVAFGLVSVLLSLAAIRRTRVAGRLGLVPATA
jgi:putative membrane protein